MSASSKWKCTSCGQPVSDDATRCPHCMTSWGSDTPEQGDTVTDRASSTILPVDFLNMTPDSRYTILDELGKGGAGLVYLAFDQKMRREVALKVLHKAPFLRDAAAATPDAPVELDPDKVARFVSESQAAAQLQHPCIVPIYDLGVRETDGTPFFTMKAVRGKSLKEILQGFHQGEPAADMTRFRLLQILHQVCLAISYMHSQKVLHRDLKPQNIMIGEWGEVLVVDFGLAKIRGPAVSTVRTDVAENTSETVIQGTLAYMPPEQATDPESVDETSDQFSLGAILYEILTYRPPYVGSEGELWRKVINVNYPKPRDLDPDIPKPLEHICLKAMAEKKHHRYRTTRELADAIQEFMDGEKDLARREALAQASLKEAEADLRRYQDFEREAATLETAHHDARVALTSGSSTEDREKVYRLHERAQRMANERDRALGDAIRKFIRTIDISPDNRRAKEKLADLAFEKMMEMEERGENERARDYRIQVEAYHDGKYARELKGDGSIALTSSPPGAYVYLAEVVEHGPRLVPENERPLGSAPCPPQELPMGSYLATLRLDGYPDVIYPFRIGRNQELSAEVPLVPRDRLAPGFAYIPRGPFLAGGTSLFESQPIIEADTPSFCIGINPITMGEYLEFLHSVTDEHGIEEAKRRSPRRSPTGNSYLLEVDDRLVLPDVDEEGDPWSMELPVCSISAHDADDYAAWRARRDGHPFRLPSSAEWEKAARGADGREHPWGNGSVVGLAHNKEVDQQRAEPIGRTSDISPYGVLGMAGNVKDWTSSTSPESGNRILRGQCFIEGGDASLALVYSQVAVTVSPYFGFRLAYTPKLGE